MEIKDICTFNLLSLSLVLKDQEEFIKQSLYQFSFNTKKLELKKIKKLIKESRLNEDQFYRYFNNHNNHLIMFNDTICGTIESLEKYLKIKLK